MNNREEIVNKIKDIVNKVKKTIFNKAFNERNIKRDSFIIAGLVILVAVIVGINVKKMHHQKQLIAKADAVASSYVNEEFQKQSRDKIKSIQSQISTDSWKEYQTKWYGFKIKYPKDWKRPIVGVSIGNSGAEYKYGFRKGDDTNNKYVGFDVVVYSIKKIKELNNTAEFPSLKTGLIRESESCETIEGRLIETGDYAAEEIYVPLNDSCYNSTLFFSITRGQYIYNIVPIVKDDIEVCGDLMIEITDNLPEFFVAISFFENIDIVRPKSKLNPKINAPMPVSYKKDSLGRKICAKDDDKPSKSKKDKGKHLDMECCLDPDEYPNPHCYYSSKKYGKYLK